MKTACSSRVFLDLVLIAGANPLVPTESKLGRDAATTTTTVLAVMSLVVRPVIVCLD